MSSEVLKIILVLFAIIACIFVSGIIKLFTQNIVNLIDFTISIKQEKSDFIVFKKIENTTFNWLLLNGIIKKTKTAYVLQEPNERSTNFTKLLYQTNYKSFKTLDDVYSFYNSFPNTDYLDHFELVQRLITLLISENGISVINRFKKNVYVSITELSNVDQELFTKIDTMYPDFWIYVYIQTVLLRYGVSVKYE